MFLKEALKFVLTFWVVCCFCLRNTMAQNKPEIPKIAIPSANASAIQKYGNIPVGYFTGIPNISIPIYTIVDGDLSIPISINYHGGGIKVSDEASQVGLGWSLSCGGLISRNVMGQDDLYDTDYFSTVYRLPNQANISNNVIVNGEADGANEIFSYDVGTGNPLIFNTILPNDYEPDQFSVNMGNVSTKFVFDKQKKIIQNNQNDVKIEIKNLGVANEPWFLVTNNDGTRYEMTDLEKYVDSDNSTIKHISSWYVGKITSPDGKSANFSYARQNNNYDSYPLGSVTENSTATLATIPCAPPASTVRNNGVINKNNNIHLNTITWSNGKVKFIFANDRQDIKNDRRLTAIEIYQLGPNNTETLFKTFSLDHDYFSPNIGLEDSENISPTDPANLKRLKLKSITEKGGTITLPATKFDYYEGDIFTNLPAKTSFARDHWGFYNGKYGNTSLIPSFKPFPANNTQKGLIGYMDKGEREADILYLKANTLKKITYPTGGYTIFEFESHQFDINASLTNDINGIGTTIFNEERTVSESYGTSNVGQLVNKDFTYDGVVTETAGIGYATCNAFIYFLNNPACNAPEFNQLDQIYFEIYDNTSQQQVQKINMLGASVTKICNNNTLIGVEFGNTLNLISNHNYSLKLFSTNTTLPLSFFTVSLSWDRTKTALGEMVNGGGLRIKKISHFDGLQNTIKKYTYDYLSNNGSNNYYTRSAGILSVLPYYSHISSSRCTYQLAQGQSNTFITQSFYQIQRGSSSLYPLTSSSSGNAVGYSHVTEWHGENGENGKSEYIFENAPDQTDLRGLERPAYNAYFNYPLYGKMGQETHFKNEAGVFKKINQKVYGYDYTTLQTLWGADLRKAPFEESILTINQRRRAFFYRAMKQEKVYNNAVTETIYDSKDQSTSQQIVSEMKYDNTTHLQMTASKTTNSLGQSIETVYSYPYDINTTENNEMVVKNQINEPVKYITKKDGVELEKTEISYEPINGNFLPTLYKITTGSNNTSSVEATMEYDFEGNITKITDNTGLVKKINYHSTAGQLNLIKDITTGQSQKVYLEYIPLVGPSKITDINGLFNTFEYDGLGRLIK